jgi:hypothetical protein
MQIFFIAFVLNVLKRVRIPVMANSDSEGSRTAIPDDGEQLSG